MNAKERRKAQRAKQFEGLKNAKYFGYLIEPEKKTITKVPVIDPDDPTEIKNKIGLTEDDNLGYQTGNPQLNGDDIYCDDEFIYKKQGHVKGFNKGIVFKDIILYHGGPLTIFGKCFILGANEDEDTGDSAKVDWTKVKYSWV